MTLETYKNNLAHKKHNPLPQKKMNQMLMDYHQTGDQRLLKEIIERNTRLILKVINKIGYTRNVDTIFEFISAGEEALFAAINLYKEVKIDFAYFAYVHIMNSINSYKRNYLQVVKSKIVNKERVYSTFEPIEEVADLESGEYLEVDTRKMIELIRTIKVNERNQDILIHYFGLEDGIKKTAVETAKAFEITDERIRQIVRDVVAKIKKNKELMHLFSELM
jgi:RNA polymerase sigma factor (sigma-70 family)